MGKKIIWLIVCLLVVLILIVISLKYASTKSSTFQNLIKYKTNSISNEKNLTKILTKIEFNNYIINTKKETIEGKECLTVFFDCSDENKIMDYYRNYHKISLVEKNAVILFALINNLDEITFNFSISNIEFAKEHHLPILNGKFESTEYKYTREIIEKHYNQDVRNYIEKPNEFMNYNIDLNVNNITIYYREYSNLDEINSINVNEKEKIETIVQYIEKQNFGVPDGGYDGICNIWLDLNNGFIIELYGDGYDNYGSIIKGNGKETFASGNPNADIMSDSVYKLLPEGLTEYVEQIIENNK